MEKRTVANKNEVRELAYKAIDELKIEGHVNVGRIAEGIVFENSETGFSVVVRAIAKEADFDGEFEATEYENEQARKALEKIAKAEKTKKAKAKKDAEQAKAEAKTEGDKSGLTAGQLRFAKEKAEYEAELKAKVEAKDKAEILA